MFGNYFSWSFDMYYQASRDYRQNSMTYRHTKCRDRQYLGHKNKALARRRKKNKNTKKMRKHNRG